MASSIVGICNRALSKMGTQTQIADLSERSVAAQACALWYDNTKQNLLRAAPWSFARKQLVLTELGSYQDNTSPWPWLYKYAYPEDCQKFRYLVPPSQVNNLGDGVSVDVGMSGPFWCQPSRQWRYLVNADSNQDGQEIKTLISNVPLAIGVYTYDVQDPNMFDSLFDSALTAALAYHLTIPLSGNVGMMAELRQGATEAVERARAVDGNEAIPTTDHEVDWIATRGVGGYPYGPQGGGDAGGQWGSWYTPYDIGWGM